MKLLKYNVLQGSFFYCDFNSNKEINFCQSGVNYPGICCGHLFESGTWYLSTVCLIPQQTFNVNAFSLLSYSRIRWHNLNYNK